MGTLQLVAIDSGWAALLGALIGGAATLLATWLTASRTSRTEKKKEEDRVAATAILLQDDFWHLQSTLARALARSSWWYPAELLPHQTTIEDRKTVWAALETRGTNRVAAAQGWMDYLIQCCKARNAEGTSDTRGLEATDRETMEVTFCLLEQGRDELAALARRRADPFTKSWVLKELPDSGEMVRDLTGRCPKILRRHDAAD